MNCFDNLKLEVNFPDYTHKRLLLEYFLHLWSCVITGPLHSAALRAATCLVRVTVGTPRRWPKLFRFTTTPWGPCTSPDLHQPPPTNATLNTHTEDTHTDTFMHTWPASQGVLICASPAPHTPSQSGPDTVQRKAGRREGRRHPHTGLRMQTLL